MEMKKTKTVYDYLKSQAVSQCARRDSKFTIFIFYVKVMHYLENFQHLSQNSSIVALLPLCVIVSGVSVGVSGVCRLNHPTDVEFT